MMAVGHRRRDRRTNGVPPGERARQSSPDDGYANLRKALPWKTSAPVPSVASWSWMANSTMS